MNPGWFSVKNPLIAGIFCKKSVKKAFAFERIWKCNNPRYKVYKLNYFRHPFGSTPIINICKCFMYKAWKISSHWHLQTRCFFEAYATRQALTTKSWLCTFKKLVHSLLLQNAYYAFRKHGPALLHALYIKHTWAKRTHRCTRHSAVSTFPLTTFTLSLRCSLCCPAKEKCPRHLCTKAESWRPQHPAFSWKLLVPSQKDRALLFPPHNTVPKSPRELRGKSEKKAG